MNQEKISNLIKEIRTKNNLTQKEFADKYGVTYQAVSKWENGKNIPDIGLLKQICDDNSLSMDDVLDMSKQKKDISKKELIIILIISVIILTGIYIIIKNHNNDFTFKTISSNCESFNLTGSIAYNKNKTSIYISDIDYCGTEFNSKYNKIFVRLFEQNNNNITKLGELSYDDKEVSITEYLKDKQFNIDGFSKICKEYKEDNLYIEIEASNEKGTLVHKIPIKVNESC